MRKSVAAIVRGTPAVIMIGKTIDPTMMIAAKPGERRKEQRHDRAERQRERERLLAAVLGREVDDRPRDAGFDRHAAQQRAEDHGHVDRRERNRAAGDDVAELASGHARGERHHDRHAAERPRAPASTAGTSSPRRTRRRARIRTRSSRPSTPLGETRSRVRERRERIRVAYCARAR